MTRPYVKRGLSLEKRNEYLAIWRAENREKINSQSRAYAKRATVARPASVRKYKYGISLEQFQSMVLAQGGRCYICGDKPTKTLDLDHNHETGQVRKLLCHPCNMAVNKHMTPELLRTAANYLEEHANLRLEA